MTKVFTAPRNEVLIIVPPNSNTVIEGSTLTVTRPEEHSDWSDYLSLGALGMVCALRSIPEIRPLYVDGTVVGLDKILSYITDNSHRILAVCAGVLTANYEAGLLIFRHAKSVDPAIQTVTGNDHFTARPKQCMLRAGCIDFGFFGNEVVGPFVALIRDLYYHRFIPPGAYPSLATRNGDSIHMAPSRSEPVFSQYDYRLTDCIFDHTSLYRDGFRRRVAPRIKELLGRKVQAGVPIDIGRGCIKFAKNDACSFCSIQYGGMWKNSLSPEDAWMTIECAWRYGYDYLYITADELPLTFVSLLTAMSHSKPGWWLSLSADERPFLVGYARADGIADRRKTRLLSDLGIRQVMIGMDAGSPISLAALNKPLRTRRDDYMRSAESLYDQNVAALHIAREEGLLIRAGFVLGHIGMTGELLKENVEMIMTLLYAGRDVISAIDIEVLSPDAGSLDFNYLTTPTAARSAAEALGLRVSDDFVLERIAANWRDQDVVPPELTMRDFTAAFMPDVPFSEIADARTAIRAFAKQCGIVIGE
jgi:radical SAM superfamily enzyme YgiQ (UPF0313 family)